MANNEHVNKVEYNGHTLIDLTGDTATEADVAPGKTFHLASGARGVGAAPVPTMAQIFAAQPFQTVPEGEEFTAMSFTRQSGGTELTISSEGITHQDNDENEQRMSYLAYDSVGAHDSYDGTTWSASLSSSSLSMNKADESGNTEGLTVNMYGTPSVTMSDGVKAAFREALDVPFVSNPNLLDNWYFVGGGSQQGGGQFPINQRGQTTYTGAAYTIDRWKAYNTINVILKSDSIQLSASSSNANDAFFRQLFENISDYVGETLTFSCLVKSSTGNGVRIRIADGIGSNNSEYTTAGLISVSKKIDDNATTLFLTIRGVTKTEYSTNIIAVKLELGDMQTLARNIGTDADPQWVLNDPPPDYGTELVKCMSSMADPTDTYANNPPAGQAQIATVEKTSTASRAYAMGEYLCLNGLLYRVTVAIAAGGTITPGTNCVSKTVTETLSGIASKLYVGTSTTALTAGAYIVIVKLFGSTSVYGVYLVTVSNGANEHSVIPLKTGANAPTVTISNNNLTVEATGNNSYELSMINLTKFRY